MNTAKISLVITKAQVIGNNDKILFQQVLSLPKRLNSYCTEKQFKKALHSMLWPQGFICPGCGCSNYYELKTRKRYLRSTCKLQHVVNLFDDSQTLSRFVQIDDAYLDGKRKGGKRGQEAEGKTSFVASIMTNDKGHPLSMRFSVVDGFHKNDISNREKTFFPGTSVVSGELNYFFVVKDAGCSHHAIIKGGDATSIEHSEFKWVNTMIGNVKNSTHGTYHAVSKKHVSRYLAEYCFRFNRRFELEKMIKQLGQAAVNTSPMPERILNFAEDWR